jgi:hypothetical protein
MQPRHALELPGIARHQRFAVLKRDGGDPQIVRADKFVTLLQNAEILAVMSSVGIVHWPQFEVRLYSDEGFIGRVREASGKLAQGRDRHTELVLQVAVQKIMNRTGVSSRFPTQVDEECGICRNQCHLSAGCRSSH